jgi:hypothetical protein
VTLFTEGEAVSGALSPDQGRTSTDMAAVEHGSESRVIGDRLARGYVRHFLRDAESRWRVTESRFCQYRWHGIPHFKAAGHVLENVEKTLRPSTLACTRYNADDGSARFQAAVLQPLGGEMPAPNEVCIQVNVWRVLIRPGDGVYTGAAVAPVAFTRHCLQRIVQRSFAWSRVRDELVVAVAVAGPALWHLADDRAFRQIILLGNSGIFVGRPDIDCKRFVMTTFLPITAGAKLRSDLVSALAGRLWFPQHDRYLECLPAALEPQVNGELASDLLEIYAAHSHVLQRSHRPGEDLFALAREQAECNV